MMEAVLFLKCKFLQETRGVTSQKMAFLIVTAMKPTILTSIQKFEVEGRSHKLYNLESKEQFQLKSQTGLQPWKSQMMMQTSVEI
jgi:hypothetical protein